MSNYSLKRVDMHAGRVELHDLLQLTGCEVSCNTLPKGASVPFVHHHTNNEELYIVLEGAGTLFIDGEELPLAAGDCFRIAPAGARCIRAAKDSALHFLCVQTRAGSLEGYTMSDGVIDEKGDKPSWLR